MDSEKDELSSEPELIHNTVETHTQTEIDEENTPTMLVPLLPASPSPSPLYIISINDIPTFYEETVNKCIDTMVDWVCELPNADDYSLEEADTDNENCRVFHITRSGNVFYNIIDYDILEHVVKIYEVKKYLE